MVVGKKHRVSWIIFAFRQQWSVFITKYLLLQTELKKRRIFNCLWLENNLIVLLVIIWQHFKPVKSAISDTQALLSNWSLHVSGLWFYPKPSQVRYRTVLETT